MAKISVVVPYFNKAKFVERCINSIQQQTFEDWEVIVVDDGSTDQGFEKHVLRIAKNDQRVKTLRIQNSGPGYARNRGVELSTGTWLIFLDADDWLQPWYFDHFNKISDQNPSGFDVYTCGYTFQSGRQVLPFLEIESADNAKGIWSLPSSFSDLEILMAGNFFTAGTVLVKKQIVKRFGGFYQKRKVLYGEDLFFWIQILLGECIIYRDDVLPVTIDDQASELGIGNDNKPIPVFLLEKQELLKRISEDKHVQLLQWLNFHAYNTYNRFLHHGDYKNAWYVFTLYPEIRRYSKRYMPIVFDFFIRPIYKLLKK